MNTDIVNRLVEEIEQLTQEANASSGDMMAALGIIIVENLNANGSNLLQVSAGDQELVILLRDATPLPH